MTPHTEEKKMKKIGREYSIKFRALEKDVMWGLFESQLIKLSSDIEKAVGVPISVSKKNYNTSASEEYIKLSNPSIS